MNSQQSIIQVFVYGTLKPGESNYETYCQGKTIAEIPAYTRGQLYQLFPGYPAITKGNKKVEGYLLSFSSSKILLSLDCLEGYSETRAFDFNDYYRQQVTIYSRSDEFLGTAWCYINYSRDSQELQCIYSKTFSVSLPHIARTLYFR